MATVFSVVLEDYEEELEVVRILVQASADPSLGRPRARVAGANAAVLLLAATFEEFIRQLARAYAKAVVEACESYERLPPKLAGIAWRRTLEAIARVRLDPQVSNFSRDGIFADALTRFTTVYEFCKGDLSQDIYSELIHNENNMRPQEINGLFTLSGLKNVCMLTSVSQELMDFVHETEPGKANARIVERLEDFFERRNQIAHSINSMRSSGPGQISEDINFLATFGKAIATTLEEQAPPPAAE
ncbi:MAE_28990/MAE_18760 family HEPN-like nuclease [Sphingomonas sp. CFBP 8760]|uniref:MAE_28990/MAE_18760 family HEPN-like nuclease n=1 Tax=Sphingomonas sp. CFBP 8760 TaxID=2775282 RepID=UPI001784A066|nr:MAE_28990/MAE_18760 family HEPN-like nuclease [Sphingomonas sp. CFBP 8760]MBD8548654.1 hypothetical protein [Sphingomonas sp. CFBP 8760]